MDEKLEELKRVWPTLDETGQKRVYTAASALADPNHPLHGDLTAIVGNAGKTQQMKDREIDSLLDQFLRRH